MSLTVKIKVPDQAKGRKIQAIFTKKVILILGEIALNPIDFINLRRYTYGNSLWEAVALGLLNKINDWLASASGGNKDKKLRTALTQLKLVNTRLTKQALIQNRRAQQARRLAVDLRKKGEIDASKIQMKASLQSQAWTNSIENFKLKLEGLQFKLEQSKAVKDVAAILVDVAGTIQGLSQSVSMPDITKALEDIDLGISEFDVTQEVAAEGMEQMGTADQIPDEAVEKALEEVDAEIREETHNALPSAGIGAIDELDRELQALKQGARTDSDKQELAGPKSPPVQKDQKTQKKPPEQK